MIILLSKDEERDVVLYSLPDELINHPERANEKIIQTNLSHSDLMYLLDVYVLEEGRKHGEQVPGIFGKDEEE